MKYNPLPLQAFIIGGLEYSYKKRVDILIHPESQSLHPKSLNPNI